MAYQLNRSCIGNAVYFNSISDTKFKSNRICVNFFMELSEEDAANRAIVPFILRKGCKEIPDISALNKVLNTMYGAYLDVDVSRVGPSQVLSMFIQTLDDKFALEGEKLTAESSRLLTQLLLQPKLQNGLFTEQDVQLEKQYLIDIIQSEINDKRKYAIGQLNRLMFKNEKYAIDRYGSMENAKAITSRSATDAYKDILKQARIEILFVGCGDAETAKAIFQNAFSTIERENIYNITIPEFKMPEKVKEETEYLDIAQSKLVMGFRTQSHFSDTDINALRVAVSLYGGTPVSRLFTNVREKMSLCYYCSAIFDRIKSMVLVDSGIEKDNKEKAVSEIIRQLEIIQKGEFEQSQLDETILSMVNRYKTICDTLGDIDSWYLGQIYCGESLAPQEQAERLKNITKEQVVQAANKIHLDSIYFLTGKEKAECGGEDAAL